MSEEEHKLIDIEILAKFYESASFLSTLDETKAKENFFHWLHYKKGLIKKNEMTQAFEAAVSTGSCHILGIFLEKPNIASVVPMVLNNRKTLNRIASRLFECETAPEFKNLAIERFFTFVNNHFGIDLTLEDTHLLLEDFTGNIEMKKMQSRFKPDI